MKFTGIKMICRMLIVSLMLLQFPVVHAGMIGADEVISAGTLQADRIAVASVVSRAEVASQLQAMGVDSKLAQDRVAALTDSEVHALAGNIDSMPAGAMFAGGWWVIAIIVALVVYFSWKK